MITYRVLDKIHKLVLNHKLKRAKEKMPGTREKKRSKKTGHKNYELAYSF